ncbi:HD domain-containing protein [Halobacillus sp. BBL2006]|uniref:HD domain-containing protein n=1 Tax=Halobacillus sp. BBL2006 TaxID=1543706 RepID=UPI0005443542|nr:HD domain-containing protein [Halobacillus sp. BBL2006]KHE67179.1 phosphohydrolase [Halobacillus sp. BBL2006]
MIEEAKTFAAKAHAGQKRKNSNVDYIVHPIRVAETLREAGFREEVICAGYLHDVVEDTDFELSDIERHFGEEVKRIVAAHTEDKSLSWDNRKKHTIDTVQTASLEVKALIIADKFDNLQSLNEDLEREGNAVWRHFNAGYEKQKWYNESIVEVMEEGINQENVPTFFHTYRKQVKQTFD